MKHIVRIAPSPTGDLHIGTLRTTYFNWLIANQNDESQFIVRIDDTDLNRSQDELIQPIYNTLINYGLHWDLTFKQSDRFEVYQNIAQMLIDYGDAKVIGGGAVALNVDWMNANSLNWSDTISGLKHSNNPKLLSDIFSQVIIKSDGSPTYNFASAVDDMDYGITWVIRGTDHIINTTKQMVFYNLLEKPLPLFTHVGLVCHKDGKKFSKRDSDALDLSQYNPDAVLNYVLRLGWSPSKDDKSTNIITKDRAIQMFLADGKMRTPNSKFDLVKLKWYNKKYGNRLG